MEITILSLPLVSFLWCFLINRSGNPKINGVVAIVLGFVNAFLAAIIAQKIYSGSSQVVVLGHWIQTSGLSIPWTFVHSPVCGVMYVVVTLISAFVHLYSFTYMEKDPRFTQFMGYLGLFTCAMLVLVSADSLVQVFLGWEGVGLCSYLLIGFWYTSERASASAMKAFIMNRVGDVGFLVAMGLLYSTFKSLSLSAIIPQLHSVADFNLTLWGWEIPFAEVMALAILWAAMGKSAQIGLHTWLPDAMEGPTPVSALIHAATMVTAGIFLLIRMHDFVVLAPVVMSVATFIGMATTLFGGLMALIQNDIKRVVAYSTCSQLGFMLMGIGVGAFHASLFHITTHAFFKALLFLGAGSVIHGLSDEQDMRNMGGLYKIMPFTYAMMVLGSASMIGIPGFSGYYSKESLFHAITSASLIYDPRFLQMMFLMGSALTGMYTARMIILTFHGRPRMNEAVLSHIHEPSAPMFLSMAVLSLGSLFLGYFLQDLFLLDHSVIGRALLVKASNHHVHNLFTDNLPTIIAILAAGMAAFVVALQHKFIRVLLYTLRIPYIFLINRGYFDIFYDTYITKFARVMGALMCKGLDHILFARIIVQTSAQALTFMNASLKRRHSGFLSDYFMYAVIVCLLAIALSAFNVRFF